MTNYFDYHKKLFVVPARRFLFDNTISKEAPNTVLHQAEAEHTSRCNDRALYGAANNGVVNLFHTIINNLWYQDLKDADVYYS